MREGRASMAVVIPPDFERRLQSDTRPVVQILVDGVAAFARRCRGRHRGRCRCSRAMAMGPYSGGKRMTPRRIEIRTLYNPEKRTAVQIVPALIGVILSMTMVLFTSGAIVRERERGNLELLIATPLGRLELMVGKLLPYRRHRPHPDHDHPDRGHSCCSTCRWSGSCSTCTPRR